MTGWFSPFLFYLARCTENELRRQVELLKAENEMLRDRVPKWMVNQAHVFVERARRDRDGMYVQQFDQVFKDLGCRVKQTAPQAPNQNAFIERWVKSIKYECLKFLSSSARSTSIISFLLAKFITTR